jgi:hypothetical protein
MGWGQSMRGEDGQGLKVMRHGWGRDKVGTGLGQDGDRCGHVFFWEVYDEFETCQKCVTYTKTQILLFVMRCIQIIAIIIHQKLILIFPLKPLHKIHSNSAAIFVVFFSSGS